MADPYVPLPDDNESVAALASDFDDAMRDAVPGWAPSAAAFEVAFRAVFADEGSTLYSLVRERFDDEYRDYGTDILAIAPAEATPASSTTTWIARDTAGPYTIDAGATIVIDAPQGRVALEVVNETTIGAGDDTATDVLVQALDSWTGTIANGATGDVLFDQQPAWVLSVTLNAPLSGGVDEEDDTAYLDRVRTGAQLLSRAPILPSDFELVAQEAGAARALVRDRYDDTTSDPDVDRCVSIYPVDENGDPASSGTKAAIAALVAARREVNWIVRVADPTYHTIDVDITVSAEDGADHTTVSAAVAATLSDQVLNPALWGQPALGEARTFRRRTVLRRYEVASGADHTDDVYDVQSVHLGFQWAATAAAATDIVTVTGHGFSAGDPVSLTGMTGGAGLTADTTYYVRDVTTDTFKLAATVGGSAIDITSDMTAATLHHVADVDLTLTGSAPLPRPGVINVTVVDAS